MATTYFHRTLNPDNPHGVAAFVECNFLKSDIVIIAPDETALSEMLHWFKLDHRKDLFSRVKIVSNEPVKKPKKEKTK